MEFLDDEAEDGDDGDVLVPSSQPVQHRRPRKKRRLNNGYHSMSGEGGKDSSDEYNLPSNHSQEEDIDVDDLVQPKSKHENLMHVPEYAQTQKDTFITQFTQPWSSPTRMRGPRWKKQATPPMSRPRTVDRPVPRNTPMVAQSPQTSPHSATNPLSPPSAGEFDDDDLDLLEAFMSSPLASMQAPPDDHGPGPPGGSRALISGAATSLRQTTLFGINTTQQDTRALQSIRTHKWPLANRDEPLTHHSIDTDAMKTWVYPTNLGRIRDYQYNIVHKGLYHNLLVALPTGLGKTFIAATIMLNWFRWTEKAQIVFVAPTKPLVAQQIKACYEIAGIPKSTTTMMTGEVAAAIRAEEWQEKRVFFMTPQTLINDLKTGIADPKKIILLVVDEAHKATGNYAYVEVVRFLRRFTESFRVLALTATPGASVEAVQNVIDGLDIARVEIRTEDSIDIRQFVHSRDTRLEVFDNSEELSMTLELFDAAVTPVLSQITSQGAYWEKRPSNMALFGLKTARDKWSRSEAAKVAGNGMKFKLQRIFQVLMSLAHNVELLKYHGIGPFFHKMKIFENEAGTGKYAKMITDNEHFKKMMNYMRSWVNNPDFEGHPKLTYLKEVALNHFMDAGEGRGAGTARGPAETRIMVFAHYRDSAEEIHRVLKRHEPMIRPHVFVGQSGTKGSEGMNQKIQLDIIQKFKSGVYNTLVATSIGEEGLDIGEVDLIVCYDCSRSPIRMLQRMGRTGRKRAGKIEVLLMRGKEENDYYKAKDNYQKMQEIIESGTTFNFHDDRSPRIVPKEIQPVVDKRIVEIPVENTQGPELPDPKKWKGKNMKRPSKKFHMPDGVETGFTFLGDSKAKKAKKIQQQQPVLDTDVAILPALDSVIMSAADEESFDKGYRQVSGTEPQYIQTIRFDAFPQLQRTLQKTFTVGHSKSTKAYVSAVQNMNDTSRVWDLPTEEDIMQTQTFGVKVTAEKQSKLMPKAKTIVTVKPSKAFEKGTKVPSGTSETLRSSSAVSLGDYDEDDSFIDNDTPRRREKEDQSPVTSPLTFSISRKPAPDAKAPVEQPWYVSQKSAPDEESEEELPDFGDIVGLPDAAAAAIAVKGKSKGRGRGKARRVVDSDDDE